MKGKKISLRLRLTILTTLTVSFFCMILTIILNLSAINLTNSIILPSMTTSIASNVNLPASTIIRNAEEVPSNANAIEITSEYQNSFRDSSIYYLLAIIIGSALVTYYVAGKALNPIKNLDKQVNNINENNLSTKLEVPPSNDEIMNLTNSFNNMLEKINVAFSNQKQFSANVAHELRTPLAITRTKIDVFKKRKTATEEDYEKLLSVIEKNNLRLSSIVDNLLELSNLDENEFKEKINLKFLINDIISELSVIAKEKEIKISSTISESIIILGNSTLFHRAFFNLIENAIKYNYNDGFVNISCKKNNNTAEISIADSGFGIPDEFKEDIFNPFFRIDKSRSRKIGGSGLGLSIVKNIIDKHKGFIKIEDNKLNGAIFKITIPFISYK